MAKKRRRFQCANPRCRVTATSPGAIRTHYVEQPNHRPARKKAARRVKERGSSNGAPVDLDPLVRAMLDRCDTITTQIAHLRAQQEALDASLQALKATSGAQPSRA